MGVRDPFLLRGLPLVGQLGAWLRDPWSFLMRVALTQDHLTTFWLGPHRAMLVWKPEHLRHVLNERNGMYTRDSRQQEKMRLGLGNGLITSNGDTWRRQRHGTLPLFQRDRIAPFARRITDATTAMLVDWEARARAREPIEITHEMLRLVLRIVMSTLFSVTARETIEPLEAELGLLLRAANDMVSDPLALPLSIPTPHNRRILRGLRRVDDVLYGLIRSRRGDSNRPDDLLSGLMAHHDHLPQGAHTDRQIRDEALSLLLAGYETTAFFLTWTLYLLAADPEAAGKVRDESQRALGGRPPELADLPRLPYTRMALEESLRLFPPAWLLTRHVTQDDQLDGVRIAAGSTLLISPFVTQRHPELWDEPDQFRPERFAPGRPPPDPFAYFPFGAGAHHCVGKHLSLLEAHLIIAQITARFDLTLMNRGHGGFRGYITLRPKFGIRAMLRSVQRS
jgi:cytochrome P450